MAIRRTRIANLIVDTSAFAALAFQESDALTFASAMASADTCRVSAGTWLEACIVIEARGVPAAVERFEAILTRLRTEIVPVSLEQASVARIAYQRFGKGNHPARLNFGDCYAYALAKVTGEPLLFKGDDFSKTDIRSAMPA